MSISILDISTWKRRKQYEFFIDYDDPTFNVTANVDVTRLYEFTKQNNLSFSLTSLFVLTRACNDVEEFRYRLREGEVVIHDRVDAGSTVLLPDKTFTFVYLYYVDDIFTFCREGGAAVDAAKTAGVSLDSSEDENDALIHYSVVPWISFTSLKNPSSRGKNLSIPKIVIGKYFKEREQDGSTVRKMPISVEAHHALMDGYHLGQYYHSVQSTIDELEL